MPASDDPNAKADPPQAVTIEVVEKLVAEAKLYAKEQSDAVESVKHFATQEANRARNSTLSWLLGMVALAGLLGLTILPTYINRLIAEATDTHIKAKTDEYLTNRFLSKIQLMEAAAEESAAAAALGRARIENIEDDLQRFDEYGEGYFVLGNVQICWGEGTAPAEYQASRPFYKTAIQFARPFAEPPAVTTSSHDTSWFREKDLILSESAIIIVKTTPVGFKVTCPQLLHRVDLKSDPPWQTPHFDESQKQVVLNYIAIGQPVGQGSP